MSKKVDRYNWAIIGDAGKQMMVDINCLKVDHSYQRNETSELNILAIARGFNWAAFNSIVVMERQNGDRYVVDGQQRLLAVKRRGDISHVPCVLFKSLGRDHEAVAFISLNVNRMRVSAVCKFKASVSAGINPQKELDAWLKSIGLKVTADGKDVNGVAFIDVLLKTWTISRTSAETAIKIQMLMQGTSPICGAIHKGLFYLIHNGVDIFPHIEKLQKAGGITAILQSIKEVSIEMSCRSDEKHGGMAILRIINFKRRIKIPMPVFE